LAAAAAGRGTFSCASRSRSGTVASVLRCCVYDAFSSLSCAASLVADATAAGRARADIAEAD